MFLLLWDTAECPETRCPDISLGVAVASMITSVLGMASISMYYVPLGAIDLQY